jgi:hypothetical protein
MNLPNGSLFITPASVSGRGGYLPQIIRCEVCDREAERNRNTGKWWFSDSLQVECVPTWIGGAFLCSARCQSQHAYNLGTDKDRELMNALARFCHAWQEEGINPESHEWCMQHLHSGLAVDRATLSNIADSVLDLVKELAGKDYLDGKENPPAWYSQAVGMDKTLTIEPLDVLALKAGLGL